MNMNQSTGIYWCVFCVVVLCYATEMQRQLGNGPTLKELIIYWQHVYSIRIKGLR